MKLSDFSVGDKLVDNNFIKEGYETVLFIGKDVAVTVDSSGNETVWNIKIDATYNYWSHYQEHPRSGAI